MTTGTAFNILDTLTPEQSTAFIHEVLSPEIYKYSTCSYYSESEYSMAPGQWQERLWDAETYAKLLTVKQTWDPEQIFKCRHCIGDDEEEMEVDTMTLPSWRKPKHHVF